MEMTPREYVTSVLDGMDLPPEWRAARERAPEHRKHAIDDAITWRLWAIAGPGLQAEKACCLDAAAALVLADDQHLQTLCPGLTRAERYAWARSDEPEYMKWLAKQLDVPHLEHLEVMRWVHLLKADPETRAALYRPSDVMGDHVEGKVIDRLDEILPCDLREGVAATMQASVERQAREAWSGDDQLTSAPRWSEVLPEGVELITSFKRLYIEGQVMRHCVASYAKRIASGELSIVSVGVGTKRSTAAIELRRGNVKVTEHKGPRNEPPHPSCTAALEKACQSISNCLRT